MRDADAAEVWASSHETPLVALMKGWAISNYSVIAEFDGEPVAMFGLVVRDILPGSGVPWLLASNGVMKHRRQLLLQSPPVIAEMLDICPRLFNYVHSKNRTSIRWLKWLGFIVKEPLPYGLDGELFHRFEKERT